MKRALSAWPSPSHQRGSLAVASEAPSTRPSMRLVVILEQQQGGTEKEVAASALRACLASRGSAGASRQAAAVVVDSDENEVVAAVSRLPEHRRASACAALHMDIDIEMLHSKRRSSRYNPPPPPDSFRCPGQFQPHNASNSMGPSVPAELSERRK